MKKKEENINLNWQSIKHYVSRFNIYAFNDFFFHLLISIYGKNFVEKKPEISEGIYCRKIIDPYSHMFSTDMPHPFFDSIYIVDSFPFDLFKNPVDVHLKDPALLTKVNSIINKYKDKTVLYDPYNDIYLKKLIALQFINNLSGFDDDERNIFQLKYREYLSGFKYIFDSIQFGCPDTFPSTLGTKVFQDFIDNYKESLCLMINPDKITIGNYTFDKYFISGVSRKSKIPIEPVYIRKLKHSDTTLNEFEDLINNNPKEILLEEFLYEHYNEVFGPVYDRIETQLLLKFPDLDINTKKRRTDIFLRNSISHDWELFEIKRVRKLIKSYRDIPVFTTEILNAIQQLKNYSHLLAQDKVKKYFEKEGIKYYEPSINLVIGKRPQIKIAQWRRLITDYSKEIKIFTYDDLLDEMRVRFLSEMNLF